MKFNYATKRLTNYEYQRNVLLGFNGILLVLLLIMSLCLFFKKEKIVVLPPEVKRGFWVSGNQFSREYLEDMATFFLHLALDVNQSNFTYNSEILMRYADTESGNYLRQKFARDKEKLKKNDAATTFDIKELKIFLDKNTVRAEGKLKQYVGSRVIKESNEIYEVSFKAYQGRLFFKEIKRIEKKNEK